MAPTTTYIPRFLLPQSGPLWRSSARAAGPFARPLPGAAADVVGRVRVRYASSKKAAKLTLTESAKSTESTKHAGRGTACCSRGGSGASVRCG